MSFDDALEVAPAKSPRSTSATERPCARRRLGDAGADDPAADHEQVEPAARASCSMRGYAVHSGFVQARRPLASATSTRPYGLAARPLAAGPR